jgi:hypothetical protein
MKLLWNDSIMSATEYPNGWVFLRWEDNKHGRLQKRLVYNLIAAEDYILQHGLKGWFTSSELAHAQFQMLLYKVGARFMMKDTEYVYMNKWLLRPEDKYNHCLRKVAA